MEFFVHIGDERLRVERRNGELWVDGEPLTLELQGARQHPVRTLRADARAHRLVATRNGRGRWRVELDGERHEAEVLDRGQEAIRAARMAAKGSGGLAPLTAPMPGLMLRLEVEVGDEVAEGDGVAIVEAMKMENELTAQAPARVSAIHVTEGTAVEKGQLLVEFEALDAADPAGDESEGAGPEGAESDAADPDAADEKESA